MAAVTLLVFDAYLPNGLIHGSSDLAHARTMAFTTLVLFRLCNVFNARSDVHSAGRRLFHNPRLWGAVGISLALHVLVMYLPVVQTAFDTVTLTAGQWALCGRSLRT